MGIVEWRVLDCEMGSTDFRFQIARQYMHHDAGVCYFVASSTIGDFLRGQAVQVIHQPVNLRVVASIWR